MQPIRSSTSRSVFQQDKSDRGTQNRRLTHRLPQLRWIVAASRSPLAMNLGVFPLVTQLQGNLSNVLVRPRASLHHREDLPMSAAHRRRSSSLLPILTATARSLTNLVQFVFMPAASQDRSEAHRPLRHPPVRRRCAFTRASAFSRCR